MDNMKKNHMVKMIAGIGFSLTVAFSGSILITPQSAQAAVSSSASTADNVIATGKQFLGVPYKFGAKSGITSSFDCSSFVQYVFKQNGIDLPRSSREQAKAGTKVAKSDLQAGDLVFSDTNGDGTINHVSIYMGDGQLLHTYRVGIGVTISDFAGSTWDHDFVTARRVISEDQASQPVDDGSQPAVNAPADQQSDDQTTQPADDSSQPADDSSQPAVKAPTDQQTGNQSSHWEHNEGWKSGNRHGDRHED
ncbi:NlpC/P60 family protein [Paenibacillus sepulcri]|uniref:NlpC/P60 family protein n=1 Tax=Paenibacillus sepulcri TaxID=359917 RepID=UPI0035E86DDB